MAEIRINETGTLKLFDADDSHSASIKAGTISADVASITLESGETVFNEDSADIDFRVESNGNDNMIFVDGGNDHVNIGTATDLGATLNVSGTGHFETSGNETTLTLKSTDDDASSGPRLVLNRESSSPADDDDLGKIFFFGKNDNAEDQGYAEILAEISDASDGTEDGRLVFNMRQAGATTEAIRCEGSNGVVVNEGSADVDFRVESNGNTHMLFVDGGNNAVGIGTDTCDAQVHILKNGSGALLDANADNLFLEDNTTGMTIGSSNTGEGHIRFSDSDDADVGAIGYFHSSNYMNFRVNGSESARITSSGQLLLASTSDYASSKLQVNHPSGFGNSTNVAHFRNEESSGTVFGITVQFRNQAPDDQTSILQSWQDSSAIRARCFADGDFANHDGIYTTLSSDERLKENITDANSQWEDIKAIKFRNFKKKDDVRQYGDDAWTLLGVIAQEAEEVTPKLVRNRNPFPEEIKLNSVFGTLYTSDDAETQDAVLYTADDEEVIAGNQNVGDIKTPSTKQIGEVKEVKEQVKTFKDSILFWKCAKALQEAMTRIEELETKVEALENA